MPKVLLVMFLVTFMTQISDASSSKNVNKAKPVKAVDHKAKTIVSEPAKTSDMISGETKLSRIDARHLLARTHFSVDLETLSALTGKSRNDAIKWLFNQQKLARRPLPPRWLKSFVKLIKKLKKEDTRLSVEDLDLVLGALKEEPQLKKSIDSLYNSVQNKDSKNHIHRLRRVLFLDLQNWWFNQMLYTKAPLVERMTLFWHSHFTTAFKKVKDLGALYRQNQLLRKEALGSFRELLHDVSKSVAMLKYLDGSKNKKNNPNEKLARAVMEIFTLGKGRGYSENDIKEAAKAFTGWSVKNGKFFFNTTVHDKGEKFIFGKSDTYHGDDIINMILEKKQTARYISTILWKQFAGRHHHLPMALHRSLTQKLYDSDYQIKPVIRMILQSNAFYDSKKSIIKSPIDLVAGAVLDLEIEASYYTTLIEAASNLGQNLFNPPSVRGWPGGEHWLNSESVTARKSILSRLLRISEENLTGRKKSDQNKQSAKTQTVNPSSTKININTDHIDYKFNKNQWLSQFKSEQDAIIKILPISSKNPLSGVERKHWPKALLLDSNYQHR